MKYTSNTDFKHYLAGLWEGDGHIEMWKNAKGNCYPKWRITFNEKDYPLIQVLQQKLGGRIYHIPKKHAKILSLNRRADVKAVVELTHGAYGSPKVRQVNELILWFNKNHNTNFQLCKINKTSLKNNAWLAGFIDADASFGIVHTLRKTVGIQSRQIV